MDKTAIQEIAKMAAPNVVENGGYTYTDKQLDVIESPKAATVTLKTLTSFAAMLKAEIGLYDTPVFVQVNSPVEVTAMTTINVIDRSRENPYRAIAETPDFSFGRWYSYESMIIALKSKFVETPELLEVVKLLGTITEENNMNISDDGFTQSVTVRKGIALKEGKAINPRVTLTPFSTFIEVEQPQRDFLLRLNGSGDAALFEADGGEWKLRARETIAKKLRDIFSDSNCIEVIE